MGNSGIDFRRPLIMDVFYLTWASMLTRMRIVIKVFLAQGS